MEDFPITRKTLVGPYCIRYPNGRVITTHTEYVSKTDIRDTPIGKVDFGFARVSSPRFVEITPPRPLRAPFWTRFFQSSRPTR